MKGKSCAAFMASLLLLIPLQSRAQQLRSAISAANATVEEVLNQIEANSDYVFLVNDRAISQSRRVSVTTDSKDIDDVLADVFAGTQVKWSISGNQIILTTDGESSAQEPQSAEIKVEGEIMDETGYPVIGAGVVQKGTTNGTVTDADGKFSFTAPQGSVVEVTCVGYVTQTFKADGNKKSITLREDNQMLEETVVVGYGVQKKSDLTGSISKVGTEDIQDRVMDDAGQALQGKTSGVQVFYSSASPGANPTIRIRGISSNGSSDPLYVVDGRITTTIGDLNPNDIESMEVLKDGASAAIYGARAGNGVVLITTKHGKGDGQISYNMQEAWQEVTGIPDVMSAKEYISYNLTEYRDRSPKISQADVDAHWDGKTDTDWEDYSFETGKRRQHNITFSGGNDKGSLYVSLGWLDNNGPFVGNKDIYERFSGMVNGTWKIKPWLDLSTNNSISRTRRRSISERITYGSAIISVITLDPLTPPTYSPDELPESMQALLNSGYRLMTDENGDYYAISEFNYGYNCNPLIMRDRSYSETKGFNIDGSTSLNFKPIKDLVVTGRLSYKFNAHHAYGYGQPYYVSSLSYQNYMSLSGASYDSVYYQLEGFANYSHTWGKSDVTLMAGASYSQNHYYNIDVTASGNNSGDFGIIMDDPNFYYFDYITDLATKTISGGAPTYERNLSYFGRAAWSFDQGKYLVQASIRADAADLSVLPKNGRWGYFPAASAGWTVSRENFWKNSWAGKYFPYLKLRVSYGENGSTTNLSNYAYAQVMADYGSYLTETDGVGYTTAYRPSTTGNYDLKWETTKQTNIGADFRWFNDKLTFTYDWYLKKTSDLIVSNLIPSTLVGVTVSPLNAGDVENRGHEFEITWKDNIGEFNYSVNANLSTLRNKVTYIHESLANGIEGVGIRGYGSVTRFEKGYPAWHLYGYKYIGVDEENGNALFEDRNNDGNITVDDKTDLGSGLPDVNYGFTFNASWKGFDFTLFGTGAAGSQILAGLVNDEYAENRVKMFTKNRWKPGADNSNVKNPGAQANNWTKFAVSSGVVYSGNYFKIKQLQLGYRLPSNILEKVFIHSARLYFNVENLVTFTSYEGFDPEVIGTGNDMGIDRGAYPGSRKYIFGLSLTF